MESKLEPVGENEATKAPSLFSKDGTREVGKKDANVCVSSAPLLII